MSRITPQFPPSQKVRTERGTAEERRYFKWLHDLGVCCLTGRPDIEIAHTGGLAEGKGMGRKSALWTCLPLAKPLHRVEEAGREMFWIHAGFPPVLSGDRLVAGQIPWAERLHDHFTKNDNPAALIADMQARADRAYLAKILETI